MHCSHGATMRNLADVSYPLRRLIRGIFAYLQDTIIEEFPWLVSSAKTLEILESKKNRGTLSAKHMAADLFTFAVIGLFLCVLITLSLKCCKEDDDDEREESEREQHLDSANNERVHVPTGGSNYTLALDTNDSKENLQHCHDRGDSPSIIEGQAFTNRIPGVTVHNFVGTVGPTTFSSRRARDLLATSCYHQSQYRHREQQYQQQRCAPRPRGYSSGNRCRPQPQRQRVGNQRNLDWFVRRTRSGQIYGMYPF